MKKNCLAWSAAFLPCGHLETPSSMESESALHLVVSCKGKMSSVEHGISPLRTAGSLQTPREGRVIRTSEGNCLVWSLAFLLHTPPKDSNWSGKGGCSAPGTSPQEETTRYRAAPHSCARH